MRCWAVGLLIVLVLQTAVASELRMQTLELPGQAQPSVVADPGGGFILSWIDREAGHAHLRFAELDRDGRLQRRGEIADGSDWFVNWADFPSLAVLDNGDWVSFFLRKVDPAKPYAYAVWLTRSQDRGEHWQPPTRVHDDDSASEHGFVSLVAAGADRVLVAWLDGRRTAAQEAAHDDPHAAAVTSLRSALFARDGSVEADRELDPLTCDCCTTDGLRQGDRTLLIYRNRSEDQIRDINVIERQGDAWQPVASVHDDGWHMPGCPVNGPALTTLGGAPLAVWPTLIEQSYRVRLARRSAAGHWSLAGELEADPALLGRVDAAAWGEQALVSWIGQNGGDPVLKVAQLDTEAGVVKQIDVAHFAPGRHTGMPRLASQDGRAVLVWTEPGPSGSRVRGVLLDAGEPES